MILIKSQKDGDELLYYDANNIGLYSKWATSTNVCFDLEIFQGMPESSLDSSKGL